MLSKEGSLPWLLFLGPEREQQVQQVLEQALGGGVPQRRKRLPG